MKGIMVALISSGAIYRAGFGSRNPVKRHTILRAATQYALELVSHPHTKAIIGRNPERGILIKLVDFIIGVDKKVFI